MTLATSSDVFTRAHIAVTAGITGVMVFGFAWWRLEGRRAWIERVVAAPADAGLHTKVAGEIRELCAKFPAPGILV